MSINWYISSWNGAKVLYDTIVTLLGRHKRFEPAEVGGGGLLRAYLMP